MLFNNPLPRANQARYHEGSGLRSVRDSDSLAQLPWKAKAVTNQDYRYGEQIREINGALRKLKRRLSSGSVLAPVAATDFPFRIYAAPPNNAGVEQLNKSGACGGYSFGDILTVPGGSVAPLGSPTTLQVTADGYDPFSGFMYKLAIKNPGQYIVPPDSPQLLTGGSGSGAKVSIPIIYDNNTGIYSCGLNPNATLQISLGTIGWRSKYYLSLNPEFIASNWEIYLSCGLTNNGVSGAGSNDLVGAISPSFQNDINLTLESNATFGQIQLNPSNTGAVTSIWVEITDNGTSFPFASLWMRATQYPVGVPTIGDLFPDPATNPNVMPIGYVFQAEDFSTSYGIIQSGIEQIQYGNWVNHWQTRSAINTTTTNRGKWSGDSLVGQTFFNGDLVTDDVNILFSTGGHDFHGIYIFNGGAAIASAPPSTGWLLNSVVSS